MKANQKDIPSSPILNFIIVEDPEPLRKYRDWIVCPLPSLDDTPNARHTRLRGETSVQFCQRILGKQDYCVVLLCRCYVWEGPTWRLYVAKNRGADLEVLLPPDFDWKDKEANLTRAKIALDQFLERWYSLD